MMDEVTSLASVPDHPLLHILSFVKYSDLAAYVGHFVIKLDLIRETSLSVAGITCSADRAIPM